MKNEEKQTELTLKVEVHGGKYTVIQHANGRLAALRYGEAWRDCVGDNLIYWLAVELDEARAARCWKPIATAPKDGSFVIVAGDITSAMPIRCESCRWKKDKGAGGGSWINSAGIYFFEGGAEPAFWMSLPANPEPKESA